MSGWFGESPKIPKTYQQYLDACYLLIVIGASLQVQPFASLVLATPARVPKLIVSCERVSLSVSMELASTPLVLCSDASSRACG